ncbi:hypothetical protein GCWB2_24300 (plasmid) [Gordonia rubripertincta]|nr:hypothetical protein GCWB2_24300 [Gordonia rubripertincta]
MIYLYPSNQPVLRGPLESALGCVAPFVPADSEQRDLFARSLFGGSLVSASYRSLNSTDRDTEFVGDLRPTEPLVPEVSGSVLKLEVVVCHVYLLSISR